MGRNRNDALTPYFGGRAAQLSDHQFQRLDWIGSRRGRHLDAVGQIGRRDGHHGISILGHLTYGEGDIGERRNLSGQHDPSNPPLENGLANEVMGVLGAGALDRVRQRLKAISVPNREELRDKLMAKTSVVNLVRGVLRDQLSE